MVGWVRERFAYLASCVPYPRRHTACPQLFSLPLSTTHLPWLWQDESVLSSLKDPSGSSTQHAGWHSQEGDRDSCNSSGWLRHHRADGADISSSSSSRGNRRGRRSGDLGLLVLMLWWQRELQLHGTCLPRGCGGMRWMRGLARLVCMISLDRFNPHVRMASCPHI